MERTYTILPVESKQLKAVGPGMITRMTVHEIYTKFRTHSGLQLHQLRVASVAKIVCQNYMPDIRPGDIILACLFHDMGNIIKSDLSTMPELFEPEGEEYWRTIKASFIEKYGSDEHHATHMIAEEIGLPGAAIEIIDSIGFSHLKETRRHGSLELKVAQYGDTRVSPFGIVSVRDRFIDGWARSKKRKNLTSIDDLKEHQRTFEEYSKDGLQLEAHLFASTRITPDDINDTSVSPIIEQLRTLPVFV